MKSCKVLSSKGGIKINIIAIICGSGVCTKHLKLVNLKMLILLFLGLPASSSKTEVVESRTKNSRLSFYL